MLETPAVPAAPAPSTSPDALLPPAMALRAEEIGARKAAMGAVPMGTLAVLAGAFIALGACLATTVGVGASELPFGVARLLIGVSFSLGLLLVIVGGAELFTGNNLLVMAWASGRVSARAVLRSWAIVYAGNLVGSVGTAALVFASGQYRMAGGEVGLAALSIAANKVAIEPLSAFVLGILCNALVCLAVWLSYSARTTTDRVVVLVPPVAAFVALGFEHSVANMYFLPLAMLIRTCAPEAFWVSIGKSPADFGGVDFGGLLHNLLPVTAGNLVGGAGLVGVVYWFVYRRGAPAA